MEKRILALLFGVITVVAGCMGSPSVTIKVRPNRGQQQINVGDRFYLEITVSNASGEPQQPKAVPGAKLLYFDQTSTSSSFSSVNGVTTQSYTATYTATLKAEKEGSYSYGPISVGGVKSNVAKYNIGKEMPPQPQASAQSAQNTASPGTEKPKYIGKGDANLFLRASVSSSSAYEQQALVYTVKLYSTYDAIKFIGATASPKFDGFVVEESKDISTSLSFETYQGKTYATAVIARYIIFPQMAGNLKVTGNTYTISVDRREYFHDSFFGNMSYSTPLQLNVTPNDLIINVKGLPQPQPAGFSGAVGKFKLSSSLKGDAFKTNQASSIIYTLSGTGNIKYVQLPDLSALFPPELEVYTPTSKQDVKTGSSNVSGTVTFDYSIMPMETGSFHIPEVKLIYFNPESGQYETSVARGYDINVAQGKETPGSVRKHTKFNADLQPVDVDALRKEIIPDVKKLAFYLWFLIPVLLLAGGYIGMKRYTTLHADMTAFNSRRADKIARKRLREASSALKKGNRELFYDELLSALWGYVGDKLKLPGSELMRDNIRQLMAEKGIGEDAVDRFIHTIDDAEFAKYASSGQAQDMQKIYMEAVETINSIEEEIKK